ARRPTAVVLFAAREGVLPVVPQPVAFEAGVEVVPREHLVPLPLARGEPLQRDVRQLLGRRRGPPLVGEVLAPAVEPAAVAPHPLDHGADPPVAPREQALDQRGLPVVVAHADVAPSLRSALTAARSLRSRPSTTSG